MKARQTTSWIASWISYDEGLQVEGYSPKETYDGLQRCLQFRYSMLQILLTVGCWSFRCLIGLLLSTLYPTTETLGADSGVALMGNAALLATSACEELSANWTFAIIDIKS